MTWTTVAVCCAAFLGAFTGVAFLALFTQPPQPRHPKLDANRALAFDLEDQRHRGQADRPRHVQPDQGDL